MFFVLSIFLGGLVTTFFIWRSVTDKPIKKIAYLDFILIFPIVSLAVGRLFYVISNLESFQNTHWSIYPFYYLPGAERIWFKEMPWMILKVWEPSGMEFSGLLAGGLLAVYIFKKVKKIERKQFLLWLSAFCFGASLEVIAFFIKEYYWGKVTNLPIGVLYSTIDDRYRIPLQLIEFIVFIVLIIVLKYFRKSAKENFSEGFFLFVFGWLGIFVKYLQENLSGTAKNIYSIIFLAIILLGILKLVGSLGPVRRKSVKEKEQVKERPISTPFLRSYDTSFTDYRKTGPSSASTFRRKFRSLFRR